MCNRQKGWLTTIRNRAEIIESFKQQQLN
ncbi:unnamed protein product, partial [Mesorhabditis belari]|uniref:Uncharacterized protein n=1 Tax=Mesorhabditis belari TaxID=2138241 RepID=A0AAF3FJK0_9BILA